MQQQDPEVVSHSTLEVREQTPLQSYYHSQYGAKPEDPSILTPGAIPDSTPTGNDTGKSRRSWVMPVAIAAAVAAVVVGGAVGGGIGASLSSCKSDLNEYQSASATTLTSTTTITVTTSASQETNTDGFLINYAPVPPSQISNVTADCATLMSQTQTSRLNEKFSVYCDLNLGKGARTNADGEEIILADIMAITAYSVEDCLDACSQYTAYARRLRGQGAERCGSLTFSLEMREHVAENKANCFLKNSTIRHTPGEGRCGYCINATSTS